MSEHLLTGKCSQSRLVEGAEGKSLIMNILLASISVFTVLAHLAELLNSKVLWVWTMGTAALMICCSVMVVLFYEEEEEMGDVTKILLYCGCFVQIGSILWRLWCENPDIISLACSLISIIVLCVVIMLSIERPYHVGTGCSFV